ncbi:MAG: SDR family oxidoreductase, partial [Sphingomonadaceae bacterium]|nr:SDR family oxidoreductase [Sphingomonadaceae bacterium]
MRPALRRELSFFTGFAALGLFAARRKELAYGIGLAALALRFLPPREPYSFGGRAVVITGGSRGLGFAMATEFLREGARVSLLARDAAELKRAERRLGKIPGARVLSFVCDVTHPEELRHAIEETHRRFGRIDILVNNAGSIAMAPFESMEPIDFEALMDIYLHAPVQAARLVLPYFRRQGGGRILNIGSMGAKIPVPHMSSYCAGKFALDGFAGVLGIELARENILVTTVHPGLMRTGSHVQAVFKGDQEKEFAWFASSGLMPGLSMDASRAARKILECLRRGVAEAMISLPAKAGHFVNAFFPETFRSV